MSFLLLLLHKHLKDLRTSTIQSEQTFKGSLVMGCAI